MTTPDVQEEVGRDRYQRLDSAITEVVDEPDQIEELRGVPIVRRGTEPRIQEVSDTQLFLNPSVYSKSLPVKYEIAP